MGIGGKQHYLWRAIDQGGEVVDVFLQKRRDSVAANISLSGRLGRMGKSHEKPLQINCKAAMLHIES